jgi:hypothetical protein
MKLVSPEVVLIGLIITALAFGGCITSKATDTTVPTVIPTPNGTHANTTLTPVTAPAKPNLTAGDVAFLKNAIYQESISIKMIGDALAMIKIGHYDSARTLAESAEKHLKSEYSNLSTESVSPALQPVKDEILYAIQDEINGTRKLRNIAVSDSEMMSGASKDYRDAADMLFRSANVHLNNAQSKINDLNR